MRYDYEISFEELRQVWEEVETLEVDCQAILIGGLGDEAFQRNGPALDSVGREESERETYSKTEQRFDILKVMYSIGHK